MSAQPSGFALRSRKECIAGEVDCGGTGPGYHACCPNGSFCPSQYNTDCCPDEGRNCTSSLVKNPSCANETWDLFDNNGYFCCLHGLKGYATPHDSDGCAGPDYQFKEGEVTLSLIKAGTVSTSTAAETSTAQASTAQTSAAQASTAQTSTVQSTGASTPTSEPDDSGTTTTTNTGAIAGGVVGGILGLILIATAIWWFLRQKKKAKRSYAVEVDANQPKMDELSGYHHAAELPATTKAAPTELPG